MISNWVKQNNGELLQEDTLISFMGGELANMLLFSKLRYNLVVNDLSAPELSGNIQFLSWVADYAEKNSDYSLIKVLVRIASEKRFDEALRQKASFVADLMAEEMTYPSASKASGKIQKTGVKFLKPYLALAGVREPSTVDILRLLRDNAPEVKRIALYIIGKFRLYHLTDEVCSCLGLPETGYDAANVLYDLGPQVMKNLTEKYLLSSGNTNLSVKIIRLAGSFKTVESFEFLFDCLCSGQRLASAVSANLLFEAGFIAGDIHKNRVQKKIVALFETLKWNNDALKIVASEGDPEFKAALDAEITFIEHHLKCTVELLQAKDIAESGSRKMKKPVWRGKNRQTDFGMRISLINYYFQNKENPAEFKKHKKHNETDLNKVIESIVNRDYSLAGIWLKVCALKNIKGEIPDTLKESVSALFFSTEQILAEEAALVALRAGKEIFYKVSERLPEDIRRTLGKIVEGTYNKPELISERVRLMIDTFPGIPAEELLMPAKMIRFFKEFSRNEMTGSIIWPVTAEKTAGKICLLSGNEDASLNNETKIHSGFLVLFPLAIEEFIQVYPERAQKVLRYLSDFEKETETNNNFTKQT